MPRLACLALLLALILAGCGGGDTTTVIHTQADAGAPGPVRQLNAVPAGNHGPHYFETPSHNIGCFVSSHDARCDIRARSWAPPPKPKSCIKIGLDWGQGLAVGPHGAAFVCAGDTTLGGPVVLPYRSSAQRGTLICVSKVAGITCRNTDNGHGFFLSRASYRIF